MRFKLLFVSLFATTALFSCQRPQDGDTTRVTIQAPSRLMDKGTKFGSKAGDLSAMAAWPSDSELCFGVVVSAADLSGSASPSYCGNVSGITAGFVQPGQNLELEIPRGKDRTFRVIAYKRSANGICPGFNNVTKSDMYSMYQVGVTTGVNLDADAVQVAVTVIFPGTANSIGSTSLNGSSCMAGVPNPTSGAPSALASQISVASGFGSNGNGTKMRFRVRAAGVGLE